MSNVYSVLNERMTRKNDLDMKCAYAYACALTENIYNAFKTPLPRICIGNRFPCYECFIYTDINLT